ncbi:MAG: hypothetical protein FWF96_06110, partial [Kiritimatiellaeota bacterium]|nr:hypothetical protein [Kiritimatiellota bacterium]
MGRVLAGMMLAGLALLALGGVVATAANRDALGETPTFNFQTIVAVYAACAAVSWGVLRFSKWRGDEAFVGGMFVLCALGLLIQGRLGVFAKEGVWRSMTGLGMPAGTVVFLCAAVFLKGGRMKNWDWLGYVCYALAVAVLAGMRVLGREYRGGYYLPGMLNPTEVVKPLLVLFTAAFLQRRGKVFAQTRMGFPMPPARDMFLLGVLWVVPMALVFTLHDLGFLILLNMALVVMLSAAS